MLRYRFYVFSGYISILIGVLSTLSAFRANLLFYGVAFSILGFIFAILNIVLNAKYEYEGEKFPQGYLGMFFNSLPILFFFFLMYKFGK